MNENDLYISFIFTMVSFIQNPEINYLQKYKSNILFNNGIRSFKNLAIHLKNYQLK